MKRKQFSVIITVLLALTLILSACGSSGGQTGAAQTPAATQAAQTAAPAPETAAPAQAPETAAPSAPETQAPADDVQDGEAADAGEDNEDITEINIIHMHTGMVSDNQPVEDAINAVTEERIHVHVNIDPFMIAEYAQQVSLIISSNEKLDLVQTSPIPAAGFRSMLSQKMLLPLDDLLNEYGQGILETVPEIILKAARKDGIQYAVPSYADKVDTLYWFVRKDYVEKYNIDTDAIHSVEDIEAALEIFAAGEPTMSALVPSMNSHMLTQSTMFVTGNFEDSQPYDPIISNLAVIMFDQPDKIVNYFATDGFMESCKIMHRWYEKGLVYKDASNNLESGDSLIAAGKGISYLSGSDGQFASINASCGTEMIPVPIYIKTTSTSSYADWTWAIPVTAREPEAAMKFMNLLFTDEEIINLMNFGIEGQHYEWKEDGTIGFPEGVDANSSGYYLNATWIFGNQFMSYVWEGNDPDSRAIALEKQKRALMSPAMGFAVDTTAFENELSAVTNVMNEYMGSLVAGVVDPEVVIPELLDKLSASGMDVLLEKCNEQYAEWQKTNN